MLLTDEQVIRYSRQILLEQVGVEGQRKLLDGKVLLIGAGGLGSPAAIYLAAAGVGTLGIIDGDRVDLSNLHRQVLHFDHDQGRPKVQSARRHLEDLNPDVRVVPYQAVLSAENALEIIKDYDVVVNGCDNFATRYLVNDACVFLGKPLVDASILRFEGQATVFLPGKGCYRCLYPAPPPPGLVPSCAEAGIIGALAGHMGTLQAMEAIKVLLGVGETLNGRLLLFDGLNGTYRTLKWRRDPGCPVCGDKPTITELIDYHEFCGVPRPVEGAAPGATTVAAGAAAGVLAGAGAAVAPAGGVGAGVAGGGAGVGVAGGGAVAGRAVSPAVTVGGMPGGDGAPELSALQVAERMRQGPLQLVDVREANEFASGHIAGAALIPLGLLRERLGELDPARETVVVCHVGQRSAQGADVLRAAGFGRVYNLRGGMVAWLNHRLPVERE